MKLIACKNEKEWVESINTWLKNHLESLPTQSRRVFLPAGETPRPLYSNWQEHRPAYLRDAQFVQLDEILTGVKAQSFRHFFVETLPHYQTQIEFIDEAELGADLAILGLGVNGHVAFHEPGVDLSFYSGCLTLNNETAQRLQVEPKTRVVSYGVQAFLKSQAILIAVRGLSKRQILQNILQPNSRLPATALLKHRDVTIVSDFDPVEQT